VTIRVVRDQQAPTRHDIHIGRNSLTTDLSHDMGGEGSGPSPHDLYDAALGACKALTVLSHAKRKNIPVEGIEVTVERDSSQERAGTYHLSAALTLTGDLSSEQREVPDPQAHDRGHHRDNDHVNLASCWRDCATITAISFPVSRQPTRPHTIRSTISPTATPISANPIKGLDRRDPHEVLRMLVTLLALQA
jgi:putative redox protein